MVLQLGSLQSSLISWQRVHRSCGKYTRHLANTISYSCTHSHVIYPTKGDVNFRKSTPHPPYFFVPLNNIVPIKSSPNTRLCFSPIIIGCHPHFARPFSSLSSNLSPQQTQLNKPDIEVRQKGKGKSSTSQKDSKKPTDNENSFKINEHPVSSLYIPRHRCNEVFAALVPYMDHLDGVLSDVPALSRQLRLRQGNREHNSESHLLHLRQQWELFKQIQASVESIEEGIQTISKRIKLVKSGTQDKESSTEAIVGGVSINKLDLKNLIQLAKKLSSALKKTVKPLRPLEDDVIPQLLDIPNETSLNAPLLNNEIVSCVGVPPQFGQNGLSHVKVGSITQSLELSSASPGSYYLLGQLAEVELAVQDYVTEILDQFQFIHHANPDFAKGVTVEACGMLQNVQTPVNSDGQETLTQINDSADHSQASVLRLVRNTAEEDVAPLFLVGGASLPSYLGYYARKTITNIAKFMPQKLFSIGRLYSPRAVNSDSGEHPTPEEGVFASMQSTSATCLALNTKEEEHSESSSISEMLQLVATVYNGLGLHYRVVNLHPSSLKPYEKQAFSVQMTTASRISSDTKNYSTNCVNKTGTDNVNSHSTESENKHCPNYFEVGRVSVCGDYISRRLLMVYTKDLNKQNVDEKSMVQQQKTREQPEHQFVDCVFCEVVNISKLLAVLLENSQGCDGGTGLVVPGVIQRHMLSRLP